ncbi:hypothetical protein QYE76_053582 [Lolium multiflorum]|uniref:Uncharacterized protein n=1 Tax=Lolium multiflorum TaxID=4521 RepID=A0AAD8WM38_LOLMU|nr:hypothetical protein QYE76_053582 [Lolium multiflorum]
MSTCRPCAPRPAEFVDKLMAQGQKNKRPPSDDGSSQAPPKRFRMSPWGEESGHAPLWAQADANRFRDLNPSSHSSPAPPGAGNTSASLSGGTTSSGRAAPSSSDHRTEEDLSFFPENQDTGTSNIGAGEEDAAGRAEFPAPPVLEKKTTSAPESSAPEGSNPGDAPIAPPSPRTILMPPPGAPSAKPSGRFCRATAQDFQAHQGEGDGPRRLRLPAGLWCCTSPRPPRTCHQGHGLGPYRGQDRLPAPDPIGNRSSEEHFTRLRCAVKELDSAWYDATNNLMLTADARKTLFEELLWEHRELAAHDKCQVIPEASIDALKEQLANAQREKDQLIKQHQEELSAQKTSYQELKSQRHWVLTMETLAWPEADRGQDEARLGRPDNATVVLHAELEELAKARKGAEEKAARLEEEHKECNQLILQTDALAHPLQDPLAWRGGAGHFLLSAIASRAPAGGSANGSAPLPGMEQTLSSASLVPGTGARPGCPHEVREGAETDLDPILHRQADRAYRTAEHAEMRTFIPPPHGVHLDEEEDEAEEEPLDDAGAGDAPPEAPAA